MAVVGLFKYVGLSSFANSWTFPCVWKIQSRERDSQKLKKYQILFSRWLPASFSYKGKLKERRNLDFKSNLDLCKSCMTTYFKLKWDCFCELKFSEYPFNHRIYKNFSLSGFGSNKPHRGFQLTLKDKVKLLYVYYHWSCMFSIMVMLQSSESQ